MNKNIPIWQLVCYILIVFSWLMLTPLTFYLANGRGYDDTSKVWQIMTTSPFTLIKEGEFKRHVVPPSETFPKMTSKTAVLIAFSPDFVVWLYMWDTVLFVASSVRIALMLSKHVGKVRKEKLAKDLAAA